MANIVRRGGTTGLSTPRTFDPMTTWREPFRLFRDLLRWDPFREMSVLPDEQEAYFYPAFDVRETKDTYLLKADLPGIRDADLEIGVTGNRLSVSGKREAEERHEGENFYSLERSYGSFSRTFTLPDGVDADAIRADLKDGVLTLVLPKRPESQPKRITVGKGEAGGKEKDKIKA